VSAPEKSRGGFFGTRKAKLPSERRWERAVLLEPRVATYPAATLDDGIGIPFARAALTGAAAPLDLDDPLVVAFDSYLEQRNQPIAGWRVLARTATEALFGRGQPPQLVTVAFRHEAKHDRWIAAGASAGKPLRAARDGVRASSWRLDPAQPPQPTDTELRILLTEQAFASGQSADKRVLAPDIFIDEGKIVLTMFVSPRAGFQTTSRNPETPVRVALPEPVGNRELLDGALAGFAPADAEGPSDRTPPS
jgi:hypothetical protein